MTRVDPVTGAAAERVTPLVRAKGAEVGLRTVRIRGLQSTVALWYLGIDSELLFVGDSGTTEPGRPSRRVGIEWTNYARLAPWLTMDADLAFTRARFTDGDPAGDRIPGALDRVISAGVTIEPRQPLFGSLRVRHFGPRPLIEDASVEWKEASSPYLPVARIRIPRQRLDDERQAAACEQLDFNPWHCLPEHRPLGGMNRARRDIYRAMADFRGARAGPVRVP